jgi:hypothetical protein
MDPEAKLAALWDEAAPPAHDPMFAVAVMERIARRRMWKRFVLEVVPMVAVLSVVGWALAPAITDLVTVGFVQAADLGTSGLAVALSVMLGVWLAMGTPRADSA